MIDVDTFEEYMAEFRESCIEEGYHPETIDQMVADEIERLEVEYEKAYDLWVEENSHD